MERSRGASKEVPTRTELNIALPQDRIRLNSSFQQNALARLAGSDLRALRKNLLRHFSQGGVLPNSENKANSSTLSPAEIVYFTSSACTVCIHKYICVCVCITVDISAVSVHV